MSALPLKAAFRTPSLDIGSQCFENGGGAVIRLSFSVVGGGSATANEILYSQSVVALKRRPFKTAAIKMKDTPTATGRFAETGNFNFGGDRKQNLGVDLRHGKPLMKRTGIHPAVCCAVMNFALNP